MRYRAVTMAVVCLLAGRAWCGDAELLVLSDELLSESQALWMETHKQAYGGQGDKVAVRESLASLKALIRAYEKQAGIRDEAAEAAARRQRELERQRALEREQALAELDRRYLGMTLPTKDGVAVFYTDERTRRIAYRTIRVEHTSGNAYVRLHSIEVITAKGKVYEYALKGGKFYLGDGYEVVLERPARISEVRVRVQHRTEGLRITGEPAPEPVALPTVVELGTSNGVKDGYAALELKGVHRQVRFRKLRLLNRGGDEYVRLRKLEVTTGRGEVLALEVGPGKVRPGDVMEVELDKIVHIRSLRVYVQHRTAGLEVEGVR